MLAAWLDVCVLDAAWVPRFAGGPESSNMNAADRPGVATL
jgi:hypothetical protein